MKLWIKYAIAITMIACVSFALKYSYIVDASLIQSSSQFRQISNRIYVERSLSERQQQKVLSSIQSARIRIAGIYGKPEATPIIIVTDNSKTAFKYGLFDSPGIFFFMPWAQYLVLNFDLMNIDITAHELVHAEIFHRIGYWNRLFNLPTWFDEGAAMAVDYREKFKIEKNMIKDSELQRIKNVDSYDKFWGQSQQMTTRNYSAARVAVYRLFQPAGYQQLYPVLKKIQSGIPFETAIKGKIVEHWDAIHQ